MKLFTAQQIGEWDRFTISKRYKDSSELMESAAQACVGYIEEFEFAHHYVIVCGTGNNGGDGLCISRMLHEKEFLVTVMIAGDTESGTPDFKKNLRRVLNTEIEIKFLCESDFLIEINESAVIIDCLFGTGISKPVTGWKARLIREINLQTNRKISIDVPSGLVPDLMDHQPGDIVQANITLALHSPKRAMLFEENYNFVGEFEVLPIGLDLDFEYSTNSFWHYYDEIDASGEFMERRKFAHKNNFGHAQLIAGSKGKMGAAMLSSFACMRAGAGLVTACVPACGLQILQTFLPEVMCECDEGIDKLSSATLNEKFITTAIGPGIGESAETAIMLRRILKSADRPLILDADALNIIAHKKLIKDIPAESILTPHVGEFDRLFGKHENSFRRMETQMKMAAEHNIIIVLKGAHTVTALPDGRTYFNSTGNVGMATAGSGDVLTGIILALLSQGYSGEIAARFGVFIHGFAGNIVRDHIGTHGMIARDIIEAIPETFVHIETIKNILGK